MIRVGFGETASSSLKADLQPGRVMLNCGWKLPKQSLRSKTAITAQSFRMCVERLQTHFPNQNKYYWYTLSMRSHHSSASGCFGKKSKGYMCWRIRLSYARMQGESVNFLWWKAMYKDTALSCWLFYKYCTLAHHFHVWSWVDAKSTGCREHR